MIQLSFGNLSYKHVDISKFPDCCMTCKHSACDQNRVYWCKIIDESVLFRGLCDEFYREEARDG